MFDVDHSSTGSTLYAEECSLLAGCLPPSWRAMVSRRQAPPPRGFCPETGRRVWDAREVLRWQAARPGSGNWARGNARSRPSTRLRGYALAGDPAWRPAVPTRRCERAVRSRSATRPWVTPRLPALLEVPSNTKA